MYILHELKDFHITLVMVVSFHFAVKAHRFTPKAHKGRLDHRLLLKKVRLS